MPRKMIEDCFSAIAKRQHHTPRTKAGQPAQQMIEIGAPGDRREQLGRVAEHRAYACSETAGKHKDVNGVQATLCRRDVHNRACFAASTPRSCSTIPPSTPTAKT